MRLLAGFALVLITIAFVQSKPISSQVKNLDAGIASLPSLQNLKSQLEGLLIRLSGSLSPAQMQLLQQQAFLIAQTVMNGNVDVNTAVNQLLQLLEQYLGPNSQLLADVKPLVQQFVDAAATVLPQLPSNLAKRRATVARSDPLALANELQPNDLNAILAEYPQYSDLINQLNNIAAEVASALSPAQLESLEEQASQLAQDVLNGNVDVNTAVNQLLQQLQEYLGPNSQFLDNVQPLVEQLVNAIRTVLPQLA